MRDRRAPCGFAMGCSIFVLERYQGCPGDRRKKSVKQADPENSKSRKRTGSGLRAARVMSDAAGVIKAAQARGDFDVLVERDRRALRVHLGADVAAGLSTLRGAILMALG